MTPDFKTFVNQANKPRWTFWTEWDSYQGLKQSFPQQKIISDQRIIQRTEKEGGTIFKEGLYTFIVRVRQPRGRDFLHFRGVGPDVYGLLHSAIAFIVAKNLDKEIKESIEQMIRYIEKKPSTFDLPLDNYMEMRNQYLQGKQEAQRGSLKSQGFENTDDLDAL